MKIVHIAETVKGGVATVIQQIIDHSTDEINNYIIIPKQHSEYIDSSKSSGLFTFNRTGRNASSLIRFLFTVFCFIIKEKPDILHLHSTFSGFICRVIYPIFIPFCTPKIIYCPHAFPFIMERNRLVKLIYFHVENFLSIFTDHVICTSKYEMKMAISLGFNKSKLIVIYNSVIKPYSGEFLMFNPFDDNKINILFVGRFDYQKGYDELLLLANSLPKDSYQITAVGDFVNDKGKFDYNSNIIYTGWLNNKDLANYYFYSDVLFMPSRWESFGLVAIEAQSYGTPVIAMKVSSLPEVVLDGVTGILTNYDICNVKKLITSKDKVFWRNMEKKCISFYENNFTTIHMVEKVYSIYGRYKKTPLKYYFE